MSRQATSCETDLVSATIPKSRLRFCDNMYFIRAIWRPERKQVTKWLNCWKSQNVCSTYNATVCMLCHVTSQVNLAASLLNKNAALKQLTGTLSREKKESHFAHKALLKLQGEVRYEQVSNYSLLHRVHDISG